MGNEVVNRRLNIYIDTASAEKQLETLTKKENDLQASIEKAKKSGKDFSTELGNLAKTKDQISQVKDVMDGKLLPSMKQAEAAVKSLRNELRQLPADSKAAADKFQEFKKAEATLAAVKQQLSDVKKETGGMGSVMETAFGVFLGGGLLEAANKAIDVIKEFFSASIEEAMHAEENTARLKSILDNIGRSDAFDIIQKSVKDFAQQFKYLDEADISGVFEKLITYGKLTETQIKQLTPVIIDFAAKQRIDLPEATGVVIKALEGNGRALKEYGIDVKDAKTVTEGFSIVMNDLKPRVQDAAKTYAESTKGQVAVTKQDIKNLEEEIGTGLLPALKSILQFTGSAIKGIGGLFTFIKEGFKTFRSGIDSEKVIGDLKDKQIDALSNFMQITPGEQDQRINESRQRLRNIGKAIRDAVNDEQKQTFVAMYNQEAAFQLQLKGLKNGTVKDKSDDVLGVKPKPGELTEEQKAAAKAAAEAAKRAQEQLDSLRKQWDSFSKDIEVKGTEVSAPILAAFIDLNNQIDEKRKQLADFLKKGVITPQQALEAAHYIDQIYEGQRQAIEDKFATHRIPLKVDPPDLDKDMEYGLDTFTKKVALSIREKLKANDTGSGNPIHDWLNEKVGGDNGPTTNDLIQTWGSQVTNAVSQVMQFRMDAEQSAYNLEMANIERRKTADKKLLDSKTITQKEYDRRLAAIEKQQQARDIEFRVRQFQQQKAQNTATALLNAPLTILSTLDKFGPPIPPNVLGIAAMAFTVATIALQIAAIQGAKPPAYAKGGFIPDGPSHAAGGISLVDNRSGRTVGEVEGGEPILSKATYRQNKGLIDGLLFASQANGGRFTPSWAGTVPQAINVGRINTSIGRVYKFADGGVIPTVPGGDSGNDRLQATLDALLARMDQPAKAYVVYGDYEAQASRINSIRQNGMIS